MIVRPIAGPILDAEERFEGFENLMPFRVQNILLVSSLYDSFILREDGRLNELLIDESLELNLRQIPGITHVSSCAEALDLARSNPQFNLIVTNLTVGDSSAADLAREVRRARLDVPVIVLGYDYREIKNFVARNPLTDVDRVFLWQGTARFLIAIALNSHLMVLGDIEVDLESHEVKRQGTTIHLTAKEFKLLHYLVEHAGTVVSHRRLLQAVWGPDYGEEVEYLRVFVNQVRKKIEPDPRYPRYLLTEPAMGYRFVGGATASEKS